MSENFLEQLICDKIKSALSAAELTLPICTFWESEAEGTVRKDARNKIAVALDPRGYVDQQGWVAELTGYIAVESDGANVNEMIDNYREMMGVVESWQHAAVGESISALDVDGFAVDGFQIVAGNQAGYDTTADTYFALINFEIVGHRTEATTTTTTTTTTSTTTTTEGGE